MYEPGTCSAMGREHIVRTMLFKRFDMISTLDLETWFIATGHSLPIAIVWMQARFGQGVRKYAIYKDK